MWLCSKKQKTPFIFGFVLSLFLSVSDGRADAVAAENITPKANFVQPTNTSELPTGSDLFVVVDATDSDGEIANVRLSVNGQFVSQENVAPYKWASQNSTDDAVLRNLKAGTYELTAVAKDNLGTTTTIKTTVTVGSTPDPSKIRVERLSSSLNPIIKPSMYAEGFPPDSISIAGASVIRVPDWLPNKLGNYYLYTAHHHGELIDLFYADKIEGPYKRYTSGGHPGVLHMSDTAFDDHVSYPDVHVIEASREIRMYFHGERKVKSSKYPGINHNTSLASSSDGLRWNAVNYGLPQSYYRVWQYQSYYYSFVDDGQINRSSNPLKNFTEFGALKNPEVGVRIRHGGVRAFGKTVYLLYSRIGDAPERLMTNRVADITKGLVASNIGPTIELLRPEKDWEGANKPIKPSEPGESRGILNQIRVPNIFTDIDGQDYLLYSVAGENGIGIAKIWFPESSNIQGD